MGINFNLKLNGKIQSSSQGNTLYEVLLKFVNNLFLSFAEDIFGFLIVN
jgi:hypothetical protein